jgi:hypothetical protein
MSWKWSTDPLNWSDKCSMCQQPLRVQHDNGIVIWIDKRHYHVACLLDRLSSPLPQPATSAASPTGASVTTFPPPESCTQRRNAAAYPTCRSHTVGEWFAVAARRLDPACVRGPERTVWGQLCTEIGQFEEPDDLKGLIRGPGKWHGSCLSGDGNQGLI